MPSSWSHLDLDQSFPAAVEWEWDNELHYIAEPDPRTHDITFKIHICGQTERACFDLAFPIYLKGSPGLTYIRILIDPSSLDSFAYILNPTSPDGVQKKLNCNTVRLGFQLKSQRKLTVLAPTSTVDPIAPSRSQSGTVLDAIRMLSRVTSCGVYVETSKLSAPSLQTLAAAVNQGSLKPFPYQHDLASMFAGTGARTIQLGHRENDAPPSYDETESSPVPPTNRKKRVRSRTQDESSNPLALILSKLDAMQLALAVVQTELKATQDENSQLQKRVTAMQNDIEELQGENDLLDAKVIELRNNQDHLDRKVDAIDVYEVGDDFKKNILNDIAARLLD
jgi:hypothetical protein